MSKETASWLRKDWELQRRILPEISYHKKWPNIPISLGGLHIVVIETSPQTILYWLKSASCHLVETHPNRLQCVGKNLSTAQRNEKQQISGKPILTGIPQMGKNSICFKVEQQVPRQAFLFFRPHLNAIDNFLKTKLVRQVQVRIRPRQNAERSDYLLMCWTCLGNYSTLRNGTSEDRLYILTSVWITFSQHTS